MRNNFKFMAGLAAIALGLMPASQAMHDANALPEGASFRQRLGKGKRNKRGKRLQVRPRKRSNRLHISKRVRNAHKRAAKG